MKTKTRLLSVLLCCVLLLGLLPVTVLADAGDVEINETNFPDVNFRTFVIRFDKGGDGILSAAEIAAVTTIDCGYSSISSLKGIEFFTALTYLDCDGNQLTSLDLSNNTALTELDCYGNQLTSLDVSNNTALTELYCSCNNLTSLDLSNNTALTNLDCSGNQLTSLDVSNNTALTVLWCGDNQFLTSLDVSGNTVLTDLWCGGSQLTSLDVSNNTALTELNCGDNQLTSLDVSINTALTKLNCGDNQLTSLDVSNNTALTLLDCGGNQLTSLDVSNNTALTSLHCYNISLTSLDVSNNTALGYLECGGNQLTSLDVSNNTALTELHCGSNQLTSLDLSNNTALGFLVCWNNQLTSLDLSNNTALTELECWGNQLTSLDLSNKTALTNLFCGDNQLTSLDLSNDTALIQLACSDNDLTSLDLSSNTALGNLDCSNNQLTSLDLSKNTELFDLDCTGNERRIILDHSRTFDLSTLPGSFDVSKASEWNGGTVSGNILTVDADKDVVTYTYDTGFENVIFKLVVHSHNYTRNHNTENHWMECECGAKKDEEPHTFGDWEETKPATTGENGEKKRTCTVCDYSETESIPALGLPFVDVKEDDYFRKPVEWATSNGITNGVDPNHFAPENVCDRAMIVTMLWRAAGKPAPTTAQSPFVDLEEGEYYVDAVLWAVEQGITTGMDATHFAPHAECTRAQIVTFLWRAVGKPQAEAELPFVDLDEGEYYMVPVMWAHTTGVTTGMDATHFAPKNSCTRAHAVTFLFRALASIPL